MVRGGNRVPRWCAGGRARRTRRAGRRGAETTSRTVCANARAPLASPGRPREMEAGRSWLCLASAAAELVAARLGSLVVITDPPVGHPARPRPHHLPPTRRARRPHQSPGRPLQVRRLPQESRRRRTRPRHRLVRRGLPDPPLNLCCAPGTPTGCAYGRIRYRRERETGEAPRGRTSIPLSTCGCRELPKRARGPDLHRTVSCFTRKALKTRKARRCTRRRCPAPACSSACQPSSLSSAVGSPASSNAREMR